jgi:DeoR/GlpR family transcriptional regulator of sugar metabolism
MTTTNVLPSERRQQILRILAENGSASVNELSEVTGASLATIHRDLEQLAEAGRLVRVHGGATTVDDDPPATSERRRNIPQKRAIARVAAQWVEPGHVVFLEASSTVARLTEFLPKSEIVVVTNDPEIALDLAQNTVNEVIILGGTLRSQTRSIVGQMTVALLRDIQVDIAFIGVSAISVQGGLTSVNLLEAETKRAILQSASRAIGLATRDKLGRNSLTPIGTLDQLATLVTDAPKSDPHVAALLDTGLEVISVNAERGQRSSAGQ